MTKYSVVFFYKDKPWAETKETEFFSVGQARMAVIRAYLLMPFNGVNPFKWGYKIIPK